MSKKQFYIVDAIGFLFRSFFAIRGMKGPDGTPTNALFGFIRSIEKLFHDFEIKDCIAVFDGPNNKASRIAIYPEYKGHRSQMPDDLYIQLPLAHQFCELYGIPQLSIPNVEADDVIGTIAKEKESQGYHVHIISQDKDLCQLVGQNIDLIQVHKDNLVLDTKGVKTVYGILPEQMTDYLAIIGDSSDNIPGIQGFGPKTAVKLLEEFGSLEEIYRNLERIESDKKREQIFESKDVAFLSKQLATLQYDILVPQEDEFYLKKDPNTPKLYAFYEKFGFKSLIKEIDPKIKEDKSSFPTIIQKIIVSSEEELISQLNKLKSYQEICLDVESTSLDKIQAELVGIGLGANDQTLTYIPFNGSLSPDSIIKHLQPFFSNPDLSFYGHNIKYDLHVLKNHHLSPKNLCFDTMIASYVCQPENHRHNLDDLSLEILKIKKTPIEALIGEGKNQISMLEVPVDACASYCIEDVLATILLKHHFEQKIQKLDLSKVFYTIDLPLLPILFEMERHGIFVDTHQLKELSGYLSKEIAALEHKIYQLAQKEFNIKSPKQLSEVLFIDLGIITKTKKTTTGFSTSADVLEELKDKHPIIPLVLTFRTLEKLRSTYVDALPDQIQPRTHRIHCTFNQSVTATGRLSCQDPNLQNIPVRSEIGAKIRSAFCPKDANFIFLAADYSQIELRILAHLSQDETLINAFKKNEDIHALTASLIFEVPKSEVTSEMRHRAKAVNFGIIYGQQAFGLSKEIGISMKEAAEFIKKYFERYPKVANFLQIEKEKVRQLGHSCSIMGRIRQIPDIDSKNPMLRAQAERYAINTPIQGSQSDIIKMAMIKIDHAFKVHQLKSFLILQIHDELMFEVEKSELEIVKKIVQESMETIYPMKVPLKVNISVGNNWGEC